MAKSKSIKIPFQEYEKIRTSLVHSQHPIIFLFGSSECLLEIALDTIRQQAQSDSMDVLTYEGHLLTEDIIDSFIHQPSLLEPKILYVFRRTEQAKSFIKILKSLSSSPKRKHHSLVFLWQGKEPPAPILSEMKKLEAFFIPCSEPWPNEVPQVLASFAKMLDLDLDSDAIDGLIEANGFDLIKHRHELKKISLLFPNRRSKLRKHEIAPFLGLLRQDEAFLLDRLLQRQAWHDANALVSSLLTRGEHALSLIAILANHCRHVVRIHAALAEGNSISQLDKKLGLPSFILKPYVPVAKGAKISRYIQALKICQEADMTLKSSKVSESMLLGRIIDALGPTL